MLYYLLFIIFIQSRIIYNNIIYSYDLLTKKKSLYAYIFREEALI